MNKIKEYTEKVFEDIKHIDENGNEYWYARELGKILEYDEHRKFFTIYKKSYNFLWNERRKRWEPFRPNGRNGGYRFKSKKKAKRLLIN